MRRILIVCLIAGLIMIACPGCMSIPASTACSTKPLTPGGYTEIGPAKGRAYGVMVMGIPVSEPYPCRSSVDRAIASGGGDALINLTTDYSQINLLLAVIIISTTQGTAVSSNQ